MSITGAAWVLDRLGRVLQAAIPQDCLLCGSASHDAPLCVPCQAELPLPPRSCPVCAMPEPHGETCGSCLRHPPAFDMTVAAWRYAYPVDRLVQALKFHGRLALAPFFAQALASRVGQADLVVPMPLHHERLTERGFNQAAEIARHLTRKLGVRLALHGATRIRRTLPQVHLPFEERARNVRGAFACALDLTGARVAVVDDVMTTGATLGEIAKVLRRAGAARVENWVVARTLG
jgi:ComF family protein